MKNKTKERLKHECTSYRAGDWIVFQCTECAYEFRENWRTGEANIKNPSSNTEHFGGYSPIEYKEAFENLN